ncbi:N-formylglutamate amidohydrolase [Bradyrhizobium sp. CCGB01]|uniref:N-formylglutamate amidohydrolase n=1 Tax=Bradyrhizobium sp. CCGB01 TaxID=2949634 RepID=UPI0020B3B2DF|nr:N-formylglutamate amidohydrolase [Bradyrhizobium sp. CCGB01]MCP3404077.1 N-formylglutamate amidohydrolase [Bradyrhizobium sp. CCGB01]
MNRTKTRLGRIFVSERTIGIYPHVRDELVAAASAAGFSVLIDRPFAGALVPAKHYQREPRVQAVMIEVNRRLYMG